MKFNARKMLTFVTPVLVLALGGGITATLFWAKPEPEKKLDPVRPLSVFVEPVEQRNVALAVENSGEVRAKTEIDIVAQIDGRVVSVSPEFTEGGLVSPGHTLITIEDTDYKYALLQAQAQVANAEVNVQTSLATANVARKQLRDASGASDLALKKPQVAQARAALKAAQANLAQAETNLARTQISLPFTGRIVSKSVDIGQYITPGTKLATAFSTDAVQIRLPLSDSQLASLDLPIGYIASDYDSGLPVELSAVVAGQKQFWQGHLTRLDASIDPETRVLYGLVEVQSPYENHVSQLGMPLAVGLYVSARIQGREVNNAYVIPRNALRAGNLVYVINDGHLDIRNVDVTHSTSHEAIIKSGVEASEKVVVSSIRNPIPGMALEALQQSYKETAVSEFSKTAAIGGS